MAKNLKCKVCGKAFAMPAHLGRHMSAMHGTASRGSSKKPGRKRGRPRKVASVSATGFGDLSGTLSSARMELLAQRADIDSRLAALDTAAASLGMAFGAAAPSGGSRKRRGRKPGRPAGRKAGRPKGAKRGRPAAGRSKSGGAYRAGSLNDHILKALKQSGSAMTIADIEKAVLRAGYKTKSAKLANAINNTMGKLKGAKRVARGQYRAA